MASVLRKLIIIISTSIFLQPVIQGQYVIYNDNGNENMDLPILNDVSDSNSSEPFELENMFFNKDLDDLDFFYPSRESRNPEMTKSANLCMAVPKKIKHFNTDTIEFRPSVIKEYGCEIFDRGAYDPNINGGICIIPRERCTTKTKQKTFLKRKKNSGSHWWYSESNIISVGCKCHNLNNGF